MNTESASSAFVALKCVARTKLDGRLGSLVTSPNLALAAAALHPAYGHLSFVSVAVADRVHDTLAQWAAEFAPIKPAVDDSIVVVGDDNATIRNQLAAMRKHFKDRRPQGSRDDVLYVAPLNDSNSNELAFWKKNVSLSSIAHLARIVHSVPASSAPSERVFSSAGFIVDDHRSRLSEHKVTMLTVVRDYLIRIENDKESIKSFYGMIQRKLDELKTNEAK